MPPAASTPVDRYRSRVRGSLLGGAVGDALGGPVEFWDLARIREECGAGGVRAYVAEGPASAPVFGRITDDTQMTLFTLDGLIRASVRARERGEDGLDLAVVHRAYDRWLDTQRLPAPRGEPDGWLVGQQWLYARRAPGTTCLTALEATRASEAGDERFGVAAANDSKGCGGVMRSAPFGLLPPGSWTPLQQFDAAAEAAGYTHGHPSGRWSSGALAVIVGALVRDVGLPAAIDEALAVLRTHPGHDETSTALIAAVDAARRGPSSEVAESLGGGWVGEEALAIAVYAALVHPGPHEVLDALALAVTHSGDSDSTGAICGNILGALHGETALPPDLVVDLEGRDTLLVLVDDFVLEHTAGDRIAAAPGTAARWAQRYPGR